MPNFRQKNRTPEKWHTVFTAGEPLMTVVQSLPATTGADDFEFVVPSNERWLFMSVQIVNCTSTGGNSLYLRFYDKMDQLILSPLYKAGAGTGATITMPCNDDLATDFNAHWGFPLVLYEHQKIKFTGTADAGKSGTYKVYLNVLKFKVGDL